MKVVLGPLRRWLYVMAYGEGRAASVRRLYLVDATKDIPRHINCRCSTWPE